MRDLTKISCINFSNINIINQPSVQYPQHDTIKFDQFRQRNLKIGFICDASHIASFNGVLWNHSFICQDWVTGPVLRFTSTFLMKNCLSQLVNIDHLGGMRKLRNISSVQQYHISVTWLMGIIIWNWREKIHLFRFFVLDLCNYRELSPFVKLIAWDECVDCWVLLRHYLATCNKI